MGSRVTDLARSGRAAVDSDSGGPAKLWIAWEDDSSIRSRVLAGELEAEFLAFTLFDRSRLFRWLRYPTAALQTAWAIVRRRPNVLVVQNPSIVLAFEAAVLRPFLGFRLAIDLHTPFVQRRGLKRRLADVLHDFGLKHCNAVIVSNEAYRTRVARRTPQTVLVLPDRIPRLEAQGTRTTLRGRRSILYVCSFSTDEPWHEVVEAAALLPDDVCIYISGRNALKSTEVPKNVILTGFLPLEEYQSLLHSVDAVMVLTTAEDNLVCGGYEAVAAGKPLVLSDTRALRSYFTKGTVFTENTRVAIAEAVAHVLDNVTELKAQIEALREELTQAWQRRWRDLLSELDLSAEGESVPSTEGYGREP